jgi:hypothetical protein
MNSKTAAILLGLIFIAFGIMGFFSNPIIADSPDAIFHADTTHSIVHLAGGLLFLVVAFAAPSSAGLVLKVFGVVYLLIGILGLVDIGTSGMGKVLGFLNVNGADNILHVALGVLILLAGFLRPKA